MIQGKAFIEYFLMKFCRINLGNKSELEKQVKIIRKTSKKITKGVLFF